ncbi:MAG TPA: serine hydrolase [Gemmatimonadaceae bacterium]
MSRVQGESQTGTQAPRRRMQQVLLACGVLSSLWYAATDIAGGLSYPGYSFTSQAISELGAIGAPSKPLVDSLFSVYPFLAIAFGVGVMREARDNRRLLATGLLIVVYNLTGAIGFGRNPIEQRGVGGLATDLPHIVVGAVVVVMLILTISVGATSLGRRFRLYSILTVAALLVAGIVTFRFTPLVAANEPTPGFGIAERVNVYGAMLWIAMLAIALLRRPVHRRSTTVLTTTGPQVEGTVAPGFEEVRAEFERNFVERREIGAAVAAYWRGEKVVDLWGGRRSPFANAPWNQDTMVVVMSTTKGMAAMTLALANSRGWLDYDAPVALYWPEFAQNGKGAVTVRQLINHEAGLVVLDQKLTHDDLTDLDHLATILARQKPAWPPGTRHGYHAMTLGLYMQELIRRTDPQGRSLGRFFREEIATPLRLDFHIGLPRDIHWERIATLKQLSRAGALLALRYTPIRTTLKMIAPSSLLRRSFLGLDFDWNDRKWFDVEVPAGNGVGTARSLARAYSVFAEGGEELGLRKKTLDAITAIPDVRGSRDVVLGVPSYFWLGFLRPGPTQFFGSTQRAFGSPGAGGSFAFADPDQRLGYAYVMNRLDYYLENDPREKALRDAIYRAIRTQDAQQRAYADAVRTAFAAAREQGTREKVGI